MRTNRFNSYAVRCDRCDGRLFDDNGILCPKCGGDGRILITETEERRTVKEVLRNYCARARAYRAALGGK